MPSTGLDYLLVATLGVLVGLGELVSRYRDAPSDAARSAPAILYMALNGTAAAAALLLLRIFDIGTGGDSILAERAGQVLAAGFGSMVLLRSSFFVLQVGGQDVPVGPASVLQVLQSAADRAVDRLRAKSRSSRVVEIMRGISFDNAQAALPAYCFSLMQNVTVEEQQSVGDQIRRLADSQKMEDSAKTLALGLLLMNIVGSDVLEAAVSALKETISSQQDV